MKTKYTKKQISEAIAYWENVLNESEQVDEGLIKKAASAIKTGIKRAGEKVADTAKDAAGAVHDTFAANNAVKDLVKCVNKAQKADKTPKLYVKTSKGEFAVSAMTLSKNKKALVCVADADSKTAMSIDDIQAGLASVGIKNKITNAIDSIQIGMADNTCKLFPKGYTVEAKDMNGDEFNFVKGCKIESVKYDDDNKITFKLGETRVEQHDKEDNDLWS